MGQRVDVNFLEEQYLTNSLFLHEEYLEINYIPDILLHREEELILLSKIFVKLLENPFLISRKVTIQGEIGIGKTAIAKTFGKMVLMSSDKRKLNIKYIHINCRKENTPYNVINRILTCLKCNVPIRGYSVQELISFLESFLIESDIYLILTLDELNYLQMEKFNLIYSLSRLNESNNSSKNFLSLIVIVRNLILLGNLDDSTKSTLQGNVITLKKYTKEQLFDILLDRIKIAVKPNVFDNNIIEFIAGEISESGDVRKGLNIIRNATKIAESKDLKKVSKQIIEIALNNIIPTSYVDLIDSLSFHEILFLYSIIGLAINTGEPNLFFTVIKQNYENICAKFQVTPRKHTQIWTYLQHLVNFRIIKIITVSKNIRGRKSIISLPDLPIFSFYEKLSDKIRSFNLKA